MNNVPIDAANPMWRTCLDHGFVHLVDWMGDDKRIVDAARVSYQQGTKAVQDDRHLIRYLMRNQHTTPFEKVVFEFHVKVPIFIARQWMRHRTGSFNEISARYSIMQDEFYVPNPVRKQSESNRQGSSQEIIDVSIPGRDGKCLHVTEHISDLFDNDYKDYEELLRYDVARELARSVLPVSLYTEFYWTVNLWNLMHFLQLRLDPHAQKEIRVFAEAIFGIIKDCCHITYALEAFQDYILDAPKLSKFELQIIQQFISGSALGNLPNEHQRAAVQKLIDQNIDMSKREKSESKLLELLFGKQNDTKEQVQSDLSKESFTDS